MAGDGRSVRRKGIAAAGVAVALILGVILTFGVLGHGGGGAQASGEIYLAPAASTGPNPFTASLMTPGVTAAPPPTAPPPSAETPPVAAPQAPAQ
ncbi:MAG TPA: serine/threonine protein kinase, partial [Candidatus Dormibacteraeota bacterium]